MIVPRKAGAVKVSSVRAFALWVALAASAMVCGLAAAHVTVWPRQSQPGAYEKYVVRVPTEGNVVIFTASNVLAGLSFGSVNPKSDVVNRYGLSSGVVTVLDVPSGASLTGRTFIVFTG